MSTQRPVQIALLADGSSDESLLRPLTWSILQLSPSTPILAPIFKVRRGPSSAISEQVQKAFTDYGPDLVFVHRDAERDPLTTRMSEIPVGPRVVPVVPVRMTEAWLLISEDAIRCASGNPNGRVPLDLPKTSALESLPDPKAVLRELLVRASEFKGRRRQQFQKAAAARRVAEYIDDYSPLRGLTAFQEMERELSIAWQNI